MSAYLDHFGLRNEPFSKEIEDGKLWLPDSKRGLVDELVACVQERKHAVVTGEPGVGKTCVLRALRHALGADQSLRLTYCHNVTRPTRLLSASLPCTQHPVWSHGWRRLSFR
jgi:type II secretory pathway predicted ATPase ExeA